MCFITVHFAARYVLCNLNFMYRRFYVGPLETATDSRKNCINKIQTMPGCSVPRTILRKSKENGNISDSHGVKCDDDCLLERWRRRAVS